MLHPYQCLELCTRTGSNEAEILVAASGPCLHTFSVQDAKYLSSWPPDLSGGTPQHLDTDRDEQSSSFHVTYGGHNEALRPQKRRKLSSGREDSGSSTEIVVDTGHHDVQAGCPKPSDNPPFIRLVSTSTGNHVVGATGEDKCIRVFELASEGILSQLSKRCMPKRPCAIALTPDDSTIVCADKFGDVYLLPLLGHAHMADQSVLDNNDTSAKSSGANSQKIFVPAASSLTVHTKGNRNALRQQQNISNAKVEQKSLNFDHQLLLGHVSLLTDIACASVPHASGKPRSYILTADRDEHVRVSRGIPQAHIIEGYCLGHTEFISKICIPPSHPNLMVTGGGDDYLLLWDWLSGCVHQKVDLLPILESIPYIKTSPLNIEDSQPQNPRSNPVEKGPTQNIVVSNIISLRQPTNSDGDFYSSIVVTIEGLPVILIFALGSNAIMKLRSSVSVDGNVLDMVYLRKGSIMFSMDTIHEPGSTTILAADDHRRRPVAGLQVNRSELSASLPQMDPRDGLLAAMDRCFELQTSIYQEATGKGRSTRELLYGLEGLRKRASEDHNDVEDQ